MREPRKPETTAAASRRSQQGAIALLAFATAVVVTMEFIVIGLLPVMARDLDLAVVQAGHFITWFALSAAILGPFLTIAVSRLEPRLALVLALLPFAVGNLLATLLPSYAVIAAVRVSQGAALPLFLSVGSAAVAAMAGPGREGRAIALVNIGGVVGIVLAVPIGVALADAVGWSATFVGLSLLAVIAMLLVGLAFPRVGSSGLASLRAQATIVREPAFQGHLLLSAVLFTAMFAAYSYLAAFLDTVAGFGGRQIAFALVGFGVAGLLGNWIAGRVIGRGPTTTTGAVAFALVLALAALSLVGGEFWLLLPLLAFWGVAHTAAFVSCQVRVMLAGSRAPAFAFSLNISAANLGIACGALAGGWIVEHHGIEAIGFGGSLLAAGALTIALVLWTRADAVRPLQRVRCGD